MEEVDGLANKIWDYMLMHQKLKPADAIFVLGSNDTRTAIWASELYKMGLAKYVICSGGNGKGSTLIKTEAETFGNILEEHDVPKCSIILETRATNTGENIIFTRELLTSLSLDLKSFILVQKPYMERRTYATFKKQWPGPEFVVSSPPINFKDYPLNDKHKFGFICTMVGDLLRIKEYPKLNYQIEQPIPNDVWQAGQKLLSLGYDKYRIEITA